MRLVWALCLGVAAVAATQPSCDECKTAFARVTTEGQSKTKEEVQSLMATLLRSDDLSDSEVSVFKSLSGDTEDAVVEMASNGKTAGDICAKVMDSCNTENEEKSSDDKSELSFTSAGTSNYEKSSKLDEVALQEVGAETRSDSGAGPKKTNSTVVHGGFAWDKHDFDVTNNKGGDVKVEVNLAAPDPMDAPFIPPQEQEPEDLSEILPLLQSMMAPPAEPEIDPIQLMSMMKDMMQSMKPEPQPEIDVGEIVKAVKESMVIPSPPPPPPDMSMLIKGLAEAIPKADPVGPDVSTHETKIVYPPSAPTMDPASIIESFGSTMSAIEAAKAANAPPPAQMPNGGFDVPAFMRQMREMIEANKPPPMPPSGADQGLVDLVKDTMAELKAMRRPEDKTTVVNNGNPNGFGNSPGSNSDSKKDSDKDKVVIPTPPPQPPSADDTPDHIKDYIAAALAAARPSIMPEMPKFDAQQSQIDELKAMLAAQQMAANKPIILPPPASKPPAALMPPPVVLPPAPPASVLDGANKDALEKMMRGMMPKAPRIPAPPTISVTVPPSKNCCSDPPEGDSRPEEVRCPRINGIKRPRCKRGPSPPGVNKNATKYGNGFQEMKCTDGKCYDADGDEILDPNWSAQEIPDGMEPHPNFNPTQLLKVLCPGGLCPEQKEVEPMANQRAKMRAEKAMSQGL